VRVHSECFTGEVLHSLKCDCREQLDYALRAITAEAGGIVIYLRQEGRGIGLGNKIRAYALQEEHGADTVDANRLLGFEDDLRRYHVATAILAQLEIGSVRLLTNNPLKVEALRAEGVEVERVAMHIEPGEQNQGYLHTKRDRMGHLP
jgi:GTP cyclohydrolase II